MTGQLADGRTNAQALTWAAAALHAAGVDGARRDARLLLARALGTGVEQVFGYPDRVLDGRQAADFTALVHRRAQREPVSRILGRREFWSLDLKITSATLDPRPDSETLVEAVLARIDDVAAPLAILDLGTGSGCLLLALLSELPRARGLGVDIDSAALVVARENAASLGLASRADFAIGDWGREITGSWQVIVSNPPYIKDLEIVGLAPEVARFDPPAALFGGPDGLAAYQRLAPDLSRLLAPGGLAALEVGEGQAAAVERILAAVGLAGAGLAPSGRARDMAGTVRCLLVTGAA